MRRRLTTAFADIAGSTRLVVHHEPEMVLGVVGLGLPLAAIRELVAAAFEQPSGRARVRLLEILVERIAQAGEQIAMLARLRREPGRRGQAATG